MRLHAGRAALALLVACAALTACDDGGGGGSSRVPDILALEGDPDAGLAVFNNTCGTSFCHGSDGDSGPAANLSAEVPGRSETQLLNIMLQGSGEMTPVSVTDQQAADVLAYVIEVF